ncbi:hypothetical protein Landi51_09539 [Colletotrichum acutatum]
MTSDRDQDWNWADDMGGIGRVEREVHGVDDGERATGTRCRTWACQLPLWVSGAERRLHPDGQAGTDQQRQSVNQSVGPATRRETGTAGKKERKNLQRLPSASLGLDRAGRDRTGQAWDRGRGCIE